MSKVLIGILLSMSLVTSIKAETAVDESKYAPCLTSLACSMGSGGGRSMGEGGGLSMGEGGGLSMGEGGGLSMGPGGGMSMGPGGGLSMGPGGGMSMGPGGGMSSDGQYKGPWTPCLTGVLGRQWNKEHCPNFRN